ncbi:hypothetical protein AVEN_99650-1 [Araneus ventricosus]|uniref:Uncharacterized protein n=1 Tax=Araneus ventricosus TaxID=182803 RepID=A0A4Y2DPR1_ARAVE|nr:hypothetical protein AVEN_99650-1 [Araneus ventricosus]
MALKKGGYPCLPNTPEYAVNLRRMSKSKPKSRPGRSRQVQTDRPPRSNPIQHEGTGRHLSIPETISRPVRLDATRCLDATSARATTTQ